MASVSSANAYKKEVSLFFNTLAGLAKNLEGYYTIVDLRNECCVTGKIVKVDAHMNLEMEDVIFYDMRGNQKSLLAFFVSARNVRHIHMPKNKNGLELLKKQLNYMTRKKDKRARTFKQSRAEKKNIATVAEAYKHNK